MYNNFMGKKTKTRDGETRALFDWAPDVQPSTAASSGILEHYKIKWKKGQPYEDLYNEIKELENKINNEHPLAQTCDKDNKFRFRYVLEIVSLTENSEVKLKVKLKPPKIADYETSNHVLLFGHSMNWEDSCDFDSFDVKLQNQN